MDGILNINKPSGMTSFAVVARIKRITHEKHIGHAGTLDPLASGVLPVCLGQATRVIEYLFNETKTYRADLKLGTTTDTYDREGKILTESDTSQITRQRVESVLTEFRGEISQVPPMFSALKHQGRPLYQYARQGLEIERAARPARIYRLEIVRWENPVLTLDIECSKGTYIRSMAQDIGQSLGCGAIMQNLVRLRVGNFHFEQSLTLEQLEKYFAVGLGETHLSPVDSALTSFPAVIVNPEQQCSLCHGQPLPAEYTGWPPQNGMVRAYNQSGDFVGMIKYQTDLLHWQPVKIFRPICLPNTQDIFNQTDQIS